MSEISAIKLLRGIMTTAISAIDFGNLKPLEIFVSFVVIFIAALALVFALKQFLSARKAKKQEVVEEVQVESTPDSPAPGSCGELKLINTDERTAAMIMAIVAEQTDTPLNELRFISIAKKEDN